MNRARFLRHLAPLLPLVVASTANADDRPNFDAYLAAPALASAASAASVLPSPALASAFIASRDERRGVPTFLWAIRDGSSAEGHSRDGVEVRGLSAEDAAAVHLAEYADLYGLSASALATARPVRTLDLGRGGIVVVFRQSVAGVDVIRSDMKVVMTRAHDLVALGGALHAAGIPSAKIASFQLPPAHALAIAFDDLFGKKLTDGDFADTKYVSGGYEYFALADTKTATAAGIRFTEPSRVKRVYFPLPDRIVPGFYVEVIAGDPKTTTSESYAYVVSAVDGQILYRENLTHNDVFNYRVWADSTGEKRPFDSPLIDYTPYPFPTPNGSYPGFRPSALVSIDGFNKNKDPWLAPGAPDSRGNNVDAYTDDDAPDGYSSGDTRAFATSTNTFDLTYDVTQGPQSSLTQKEAAITQLFYVTNWMHDWWYDSGFDEAGGNAQADNYGRGGIAGDVLHAEGQDGAPGQRNNSDMSVPADGASPRMQMFVWDGPPSLLTFQPGNLSMSQGAAAFGPKSFTTTGTLVLADDGTAPDTHDVCESIVNNVTGQIAVIDRGTCTFKSKAARAQAAGAIGVILIDNQSQSTPPPLSDDPSTTTPITIPMVSVTKADGDTIKLALMSGPASATIRSSVDFDGTIDNTVIAHEWGHYLHLRHVTCGSPACSAESEGWADFNALMMVVHGGDDYNGAFPLAQYATVAFPDPAYFGIRRFPYSTDFSKDPLTFKDITSGQALPTTAPISPMSGGDNAEVHAAGEVWAAMLFEGYAGMLKQTTLPTPPYAYDEAHRRMGDYIVAGMTAAPANPTYTEQRDAVLSAAAAKDPNDLALLAQGFAKRGAGTCAVSPARDSTDFSGVVESFSVVANLSIDSVTLDDAVMSCDNDGYLDAGEIGHLTVHATNNGATPAAAATASVTTSTPGITFPDGPQLKFGSIGIFGSATASIRVQLDPSVTQKSVADLLVTSDAVGCSSGTREAFFPINVDEVGGSSATDDVEAKATAWKTSGTAKIWSRIVGAKGNHLWAGIDYSAPSDSQLTSPSLDVSATDPFVMTFTHRHSFEHSMNVNWDGAVIEVSVDGGAWGDISKYGSAGYGGQIGDPQGQAMNALKGRQGYVATNKSWPASDMVKIDMGNSLAGHSVRIRFRIGTDDAVGDVGWQIDDVSFQGITNTPFPALVQNMNECWPPATTSSTSSASGAGGGSPIDVEVRGEGCSCELPRSDGSGWASLAAAVAGTLLAKKRRRR